VLYFHHEERESMRRLQLQDRVVFPELNLIARGDVRVHLEPKAMEVLLELAKHPGVSGTPELKKAYLELQEARVFGAAKLPPPPLGARGSHTCTYPRAGILRSTQRDNTTPASAARRRR